jgi:iron complex transport system ATP-binding protein
MISCHQLQLPHVAFAQPLSLQFESGQRWAIIGPNGAGKSLLLACLAGWLQPKAGQVHWSPAAGDSSVRGWAQRVSYQPAAVSLAFAETMAQRLDLQRQAQGSSPVFEQSSLQLIQRFALQPLMTRDLQTASSGEQQRAWLLTRLLQNAAAILLDEPLAHLDFEYQLALGELLQADARLSICVVHQPEWATRFCTHVLAISRDGQCKAVPSALVDGALLSQTYGVPFSLATAADGSHHWVR